MPKGLYATTLQAAIEDAYDSVFEAIKAAKEEGAHGLEADLNIMLGDLERMKKKVAR